VVPVALELKRRWDQLPPDERERHREQERPDVHGQTCAERRAARRARERVVRVRERQRPRDGVQELGHVGTIDEQAGQQELREDQRRHELHGLELRPGERADEQPERHPEQRVGDRQQTDEDRAVRRVDDQPRPARGQLGP